MKCDRRSLCMRITIIFRWPGNVFRIMHEALVEDTSSAMWCFAIGRVFLVVSKDFSAVVFRVQQPKEELQVQRHNAACQKSSIFNNSTVSATDLTKHHVLFAFNILWIIHYVLKSVFLPDKETLKQITTHVPSCILPKSRIKKWEIFVLVCHRIWQWLVLRRYSVRNHLLCMEQFPEKLQCVWFSLHVSMDKPNEGVNPI